MLRELLLLTVCGAGAWLFFHHDLLYTADRFRPTSIPVGAFLLTTLLLYLFIRVIIFVAGLRVPRVRDGVEVCPECGQPIDDATPSAVPPHAGHPGPARARTEEARATVALRRAIREAREAAGLSGVPSGVSAEVSGTLENPRAHVARAFRNLFEDARPTAAPNALKDESFDVPPREEIGAAPAGRMEPRPLTKSLSRPRRIAEPPPEPE